MRIACLLLVLLSACSGDEVDHGTATCTGAAYDTCRTEHDCLSNECRGDICTQACSDSTPCPQLDGVDVACNAANLCEPAMSNGCEVRDDL